MEKIKILFVDFWNGFDHQNNIFTKIISKNYFIEFSEDPDYIIYSCFGYKHLKYKCVRIFYTGENLRPDFNICDYAMGFDWMSFGDRYYRLPYYFLHENDCINAVYKRSGISLEGKTEFCNYIYTNHKAHPNRDNFFYMLNEYKFVSSGGKHLNNIGHFVIDKDKFQRQFKFSIAFENSITPGYTTEKLIQAMAAETIPIYWGDPLIHRDFNTKSFINCHEYDSFKDILEKVKEVDQDDELYVNIINQPFVADPKSFIGNYYNGAENFFADIFSQGPEDAFRRELYCMGKRYEKGEVLQKRYYSLYILIRVFAGKVIKPILFRFKLLKYRIKFALSQKTRNQI